MAVVVEKRKYVKYFEVELIELSDQIGGSEKEGF